MNKPIQLLVITWSCVMMLATILLIREYSYVREQSYKIVALKIDYENHLMEISRALHEYQTDNEKKNETSDPNQSISSFPEGARVVSSNEVATGEAHFVVINRESEYLKKSTIDYIHEQKLAPILHQISPHQWQNYTEHVEQQVRKRVPVRARKKQSKRRQLVRNQKLPRAQRSSVIADFEFSWPIDRSNIWLSSFFGPRKKANGSKGFHYGLDMAACKGTPVLAAAPGIVIEARKESDSGGYGNTIVVAHNRKYRTRYAHLKTMKVRIGEHVARGALIGTVGDTGLVRSRGRDASHLHFEISMYGKKVDPLAFLS